MYYYQLSTLYESQCEDQISQVCEDEGYTIKNNETERLVKEINHDGVLN